MKKTRLRKVLSVFLSVIMLALPLCFSASAEEKDSVISLNTFQASASVDSLISKLKNNEWVISVQGYEGDPTDEVESFYVNSSGQLIYKEIYYDESDDFETERTRTQVVSFKKNNAENAIEFSAKGVNTGNRSFKITDFGFDNFLLIEITRSYGNFYYPLFKNTGYSGGSNIVSSVWNKYWFSSRLNRYGANYVYLNADTPSYGRYFGKAAINTNNKNYTDYWWTNLQKDGIEIAFDIYQLHPVAFIDESQTIYLFMQGSKLYAMHTFNKNASNPRGQFVGDYEIEEWTKCFPDVRKTDWYYDVVNYVFEKGYMTGYANGKFGSGDNIKRQDFIVTLARISGANLSSYKNQTPKFTDVKKGDYYAAAVNWAVANGIVSGYGNGKFGVGDAITREQVATILYNYKSSPAVNNVNGILAKFSDRNKISSYAKKPIAWAVDNGIISGMADGKIAAQQGASRAQIAAIIQRMDQQGMFK